ncbi:MAG: anhydro-N-acetylmuramic acid kinase [Elusimicrobiota bacterium]
MKNLKVLGLMSGTSADGLSLAYCAVNIRKRLVKVFAYHSFEYPPDLKREIESARDLKLEKISALNFKLGKIWASYCVKFLKKFSLPNPDIVSSHGQTVYHSSKQKHTLQIGEISFITEKLKIPGVCDFRPQDMAAGGEGAPLVPFFDEFLFGEKEPAALLNIGGVANISVTGKNIKTFGFDVGPGNSLMDWAVSVYSCGKKTYDKNGEWALKGKPDLDKIKKMLSAPFFSKKPPKSLDREEFGLKFLKSNFNLSKEKKEDVLATLNLFSAFCVKKSFSFFNVLPEKVIVSGGGALNNATMKNLSSLLPFARVISIKDFGIHPLAKEPAAFALIGALAWLNIPNCPFSSTGASGPRILGKISYPFGRPKL